MTGAAEDLLGLVVDLVGIGAGVPEGARVADRDEVRAAVTDRVLPHLTALEPDEIRTHPEGDVAVRFGPDRPDGLLLLGYVVAQHGDPSVTTVEVEGTGDATRIAGRGAAQGRGALAAGFAAAAATLAVTGAPLERPLWIGLNTEDRSSHGGSMRLLDDLGVRADRAIVLTGTDLRVSRANRGRVDLVVTVPGRAGHSSQPQLADSPIDRVPAVVDALRAAPLPPPHPVLGPAAVVPFDIRSEPVAPHTIPERVVLTVDRRLLPGESPEAAARSLTDHLDRTLRPGLAVVEPAAWMLPAEVAADDPLVVALLDAIARQGRIPEAVASAYTFDAGLACARGIPTVMFGPGRRSFGADLTAPESVLLADVVAAAGVLREVAGAWCGGPPGQASAARSGA